MINKLSKTTDFELEKCSQVIGMSVAGFRVRIVFRETEFVMVKKIFIKSFLSIWDREEFLIPYFGENYDFTIFIDQENDKDLNKEAVDENEKNASSTHISMNYIYGIFSFQIMFKGVVVKLVYENNGFILHAGSCYKDKELRAFSAASGGGKSTTNKMLESQGYNHFSDDFLIVKRDGSGWEYFGAPFAEKSYMPVNKSLKKIKVYFVEKEKPVKLEKIKSGGESLKRLMAQIFRLDGFDQKKVNELVLDFAMENKVFVLERDLNAERLKEVLNEN